MATIFDETMSSMRPEIQSLIRKAGIKSERIRIELSQKEFDMVFTPEAEEELKLNLGEKIELRIFFNVSSTSKQKESELAKKSSTKNAEKDAKKKDESLTEKGFRPRLQSKGFGLGAIETVRLQQKLMMDEIAKRKEETLKGTYDFLDGSRYIGELNEGIPCGKGTCHYINGNKFVGKITECSDNEKNTICPKINGSGVLYYSNKNKYVGEIKEDKAHGTGVIHFSNGSTYEGDVSNDQANGQGILYLMTGQAFDGEWKDDKFFGKSTIGSSPSTNGKACSVF